MDDVEVKTNAQLGFYGCHMLARYTKLCEQREQRLLVNMEDTISVTTTGVAVLMRAANDNPHVEFINVTPDIMAEMKRVGQAIKEAEENGGTGS